MSTDFYHEYTLIEALAELYNFNPRKKKNAQIVFEISEKIDPINNEIYKFGKNWAKFDHKWEYFDFQTNCPVLGCEERHFVSNLFTNSFAKKYMHYGAQQGTYRVHKIYDSRIDDKWHRVYV